MTKLLAYKDGNKTKFYEAEDFEPDYELFSLLEENGAFLLFENDSYLDSIIGIHSTQEGIDKIFSKYCKDNDFSDKYFNLKSNPKFLSSLIEIKNCFDYPSNEELVELIDNEERIRNNVEQILSDFKSDYIQPIYNEYISRSRFSQKKIDDLEELLELTIYNYQYISFFDSLEDLLRRLTFFISKDIETILFIQNNISNKYRGKYIENIDTEKDEETHFFLKMIS